MAGERDLNDDQLQSLKNLDGADAKARAGRIYQKLKEYVGTMGDTKEEFLSDVIAPLLSEEMAVYRELEKDIFEEVDNA